MEKLKYIIIVIITLTSCGVEPIKNHKGCIIHKKDNSVSAQYFLLERYNTKASEYEFEAVHVTKYDFNKYNIGDTIK